MRDAMAHLDQDIAQSFQPNEAMVRAFHKSEATPPSVKVVTLACGGAAKLLQLSVACSQILSFGIQPIR